MAETFSKMIPLGTTAPFFDLEDTVSGKKYSLSELRGGTATVIMFICNHCPYVLHVIGRLSLIPGEYRGKGISFAAISSNDIIAYPQDAPDRMKEFAESHRFSFPYLFDPTQEVARAYSAACTPDFFVFDREFKLVYRGQMDDSRPGNSIAVTGNHLKNALDNLIIGKPVDPVQKPSIGCSIKWRN